MKCPNCKFTCSTSRDLCPKCAFDLRPHKRALGERIADPDANYDDLYAKYFSDAPPTFESEKLEKAKAAKSGSFFSRFKKEDGSDEASESVESETTSETEESVSDGINRSLIDETAVMSMEEFRKSEQSELKLSPEQEEKSKEEVVIKEVDSAFPSGKVPMKGGSANPLIVKPDQSKKAGSVKSEAADEAAKESSTEKSADSEAKDSDSGQTGSGASEKPVDNSSALRRIPSANGPQTRLANAGRTASSAMTKPDGGTAGIPTAPKLNQTTKSGAMQKPTVGDSSKSTLGATDSQNSSENGSNQTQTAMSASVPQASAQAVDIAVAYPALDYSFLDHPAVMALFSDARASISEDGFHGDIDLWNFRTFDNDEDIKVLFDLARDSVIDPTLESRLVNDVIMTEKREVKTDIVQAQLERTVKKLAAPVLTLKGGKLNFGKKSAADSDENFAARKMELPMASRRWMALAFAIDMAVVAVMSLFVMVYFSLASGSTVVSKLFTGQHTTNLEFVPFVGVATHSFVWMMLVYFASSLLIFGATVGTMVCRLEFLRDNGEEPLWPNIFVRTALLPVSYACFGYLPILFGRRPFHDMMSRMVLCATQTEKTPKLIKRRKPVKLKKRAAKKKR